MRILYAHIPGRKNGMMNGIMKGDHASGKEN